MDGNYQELKDAVVGATQQGSPTSPLGDFPELAKMYSSSFQVPLSNAATQVQAANTAVTVRNQAAAAAAARAAAAHAASVKKQQLEDMLNPDKYRIEQRDDGGYGFYAPDGREVSVSDFAKISGTTPNKILADSQNPIDIGYRQDYQNLQDYIQAKLNSNHDDSAKQQALAIEDAVRQDSGVDLGKLKIQDVLERFKQAYPTIYGRTNTGVRSGQLFIPGTSRTTSYGIDAGSDTSAGIGS